VVRTTTTEDKSVPRAPDFGGQVLRLVIGGLAALSLTLAGCGAAAPPSADGYRPPVSSHEPRARVACAKSMRRHGYSRFANPTFAAGGGICSPHSPPDDQRSPAFRRVVTTRNKATGL
jgi:hypothetical protein